MVAIEDIKTSLIFKKFGANSEYIDISSSVAASTVTTYTYTVPSGYAWIKVDSMWGPITNRVLELTIRFDESVECADVNVGLRWGRESVKSVLGGIAYNRYTLKVRNTDASAAHDMDVLERGFLVRTEDVRRLLEELRKVSLTDESIEKLAEKISVDVRDMCLKAGEGK